MVPLLAATSAVSAVGSVASSAVKAWQELTASRSASKSAAQGANPGSGATDSSSDSFSTLLSAQGVDVNSAGSAGASQDTAKRGAGHHGDHHHLDRSA